MKSFLLILLCCSIISCTDNSTDKPNTSEIVKKIYFHAYDYAPNFFFIDTAYLAVYYEYFKLGIPVIPGWAADLRIGEIEVWESINDLRDIYFENGVAFADLEPKKSMLNEKYNDDLKITPVEAGKVERAFWIRLDSSDYSIDVNLGILNIMDFKSDRMYAVAYRINGESVNIKDDLFYGTFSHEIRPNDTLLLKLIYRPNMCPEFTTLWQRQMKNIYQSHEKNIDINNAVIKIFYIDRNGDTLDYIEQPSYKLLEALGADKLDEIGAFQPDGKFDISILFDNKEGRIILPALQPFNTRICSYLTEIGREDIKYLFTYPQVYLNIKEEARQAIEKDKYLIMLEIKK